MSDSVSGKLQSIDIASEGQSTKILCEPCLEDETFHDVVGFCVDCQNYLCETCYKCHCIPRPMRGHKLLDKSEMPLKKPSSNVSLICEMHEGEEIKYFCKLHKAVGCSSCIITQHKACNEILTIADIAKDIETWEDYRNLCTTLERLETELESHSENIKANKAESLTCLETAKTEINNFRKKMIEHFDNLGKLFVHQASKIHEGNVNNLETIEQDVKASQSEVQQLKEELKILRESKQNKQLFIATVNAMPKQNALQKKSMQSQAKNVIRSCYFKPNENMTQLLAAGSPKLGLFGQLYSTVASTATQPKFTKHPAMFPSHGNALFGKPNASRPTSAFTPRFQFKPQP